MQTRTEPLRRRLLPAGFGLVALLCASITAPAEDLVINAFDDDQGGSFGLSWVNFRSYASGVTSTFDPAQDSTGNPGSGSMYVQIQWPLHSDPNWNNSWNDVQFAWSTPVFSPSDYIKFECDVKIDVTNSAVALGGSSYGAIELIVNDPWQNILGWQTLQITNGWQRISGSFAADPNETQSQAIIGFISNGNDSLTNTLSLWIDNIVFTAPPSVNTNRPALSLAKAPPPGLTCLCSVPQGTWQRQMVSTVNSNYSWITDTAASETTTYSMTIAAAPEAKYNGFQSQMFLIPALGMVDGASVDWNSANVMSFFVQANSEGTGSGTLQYKVNNPGSWTTALVVNKTCATGVLGKWSLTFNQNTNVTITAPDNTSTNFTIAAAHAAAFADPLSVYLGTLPNDNANIGQSSTFSRFQVTGAAGSINDSFATLDAATWVKYSEDPAGVFITAPDAKYWITWPVPDAGFTALSATDNLANQLGGAQWKALPASDTGWKNVGGATRFTVINQSTLNAAFGYNPTHCFFGLFHE